MIPFAIMVYLNLLILLIFQASHIFTSSNLVVFAKSLDTPDLNTHERKDFIQFCAFNVLLDDYFCIRRTVDMLCFQTHHIILTSSYQEPSAQLLLTFCYVLLMLGANVLTMWLIQHPINVTGSRKNYVYLTWHVVNYNNITITYNISLKSYIVWSLGNVLLTYL